MLISVVVPCYNEEKVLQLTYNELSCELAEITHDYEIIFVNDGSRDGTLECLKSFAETSDKVKYISFSRNFGKESAMLAGMGGITKSMSICGVNFSEIWEPSSQYTLHL